MKDSIISLEDGFNYYIIEELDYLGKKYVLGSLVNLAEDELDDENLLVKEIVQDGESYRVVSIEDDQEAADITKLLISKFQSTEEE